VFSQKYFTPGTILRKPLVPLVAEKACFVAERAGLPAGCAINGYFAAMKKPWYQQKWAVLSLHVITWLFLFSLPYLLRSSYKNEGPKKPTDESGTFFLFGLIMNAIWVSAFYFNAFWLVPRFIYRKRYWWFAFAQLLLLFLLLFTSASLFRLLVSTKVFSVGPHLLVNFFIYLLIFSGSTTYRMVSDKIGEDRRLSEKENENLKTELALLRSQVSPHFMFNVLNNMVALARKKSDLLEPSLIKLSSLMRYMLYEADEEKVSLDKEIEYLQSYIDLQRQRFGNKVRVQVDLQADNEHYQIEPMLLIPFVENAFKHGTTLLEDPMININLQAEKNLLNFSVENRYNGMTVEEKDKTSGIGLANVKRRLQLLYNDAYKLNISNHDHLFTITLQIQLS